MGDKKSGAKSGKGRPSFLEIAAAARAGMPETPVYHHEPVEGASPERVRELAGILKLDRPAPSRKFLKG